MTRIGVIVAVAAMVAVGLDLVFEASMPGVTAALGFVGGVVIILGSKWLGTQLLQQPEASGAETDHPEVRDGA